tara:strand:+ start:520 stop:1086 length:567 start_codon:yes stop_codon:yes gene_type:complete
MSFIAQVTISIVIYFIIRIFNRSEKSLYFSSILSALSYVILYLSTYEVLNVLATIHFIVTGLSLLFLFIAYNEIIILERKVRKIKKGEITSSEIFPVEKGYKIVFKMLGIGLVFLSLALISGLSMQSIFTANLIFKAIFTFIAWLIYVVTLVGIKFFNFPTKYATRSLFVAMWAVLAAYYMNSYLIEL